MEKILVINPGSTGSLNTHDRNVLPAGQLFLFSQVIITDNTREDKMLTVAQIHMKRLPVIITIHRECILVWNRRIGPDT